MRTVLWTSWMVWFQPLMSHGDLFHCLWMPATRRGHRPLSQHTHAKCLSSWRSAPTQDTDIWIRGRGQSWTEHARGTENGPISVLIIFLGLFGIKNSCNTRSGHVGLVNHQFLHLWINPIDNVCSLQ